MPIYEYRAVEYENPEKSCRICSRGFELRRPVDREPLLKCPLCQNAVQKKISNVNSPKVAKPFSIGDAKRAGFTVLEKKDQGVFERH